jgi:hypothetical protein
LYFSTFTSSFGGGMPGLVTFDTGLEKMNRNKNANSNDKKKSDETQVDKKTLLSLFEINIIRYSLFIDNIKPEQIDPFFMIDFMSLPEDYFLEENIQKYGIHFCFYIIKLKLQKTKSIKLFIRKIYFQIWHSLYTFSSIWWSNIISK